jgi:hypothetical protein
MTVPMRRLASFLAIFTFILLSETEGLALPQNAEEFRKEASTRRFYVVEEFEVDRTFTDLAAVFKKKTEECLLNMVYEVVWYGRQTVSYYPSVIMGKNKVEFILQTKHNNAVYFGRTPPKGGEYRIVAEAVPISKDKVHVVIYRFKNQFTNTANAVRHWAKGTNSGCPDLNFD